MKTISKKVHWKNMFTFEITTTEAEFINYLLVDRFVNDHIAYTNDFVFA